MRDGAAGDVDDEILGTIFGKQQPIPDSASALGRDAGGVLLGSERLIHLQPEPAPKCAQIRMGVDLIPVAGRTIR